MTPPLAVLPMYDWPEIRPATDRLWAAIRDQLVRGGIDAPVELTRPADLESAWTDEGLVIGQTCGLPLVTVLPGAVVVGAFDHRLPDTPPGWYHSVMIVGSDDPATTIADLRGATVAVNGTDSQSGHAAWRHELAAAGLVGDHLGEVSISGGHRSSIIAVAEGAVRTAAIDGVSWELARTHEPAAADCRILHHSSPTPGLPIITNQPGATEPMRAAIAAAIDTLSAADRRALHIHAIVSASRDHYELLARRWADATAAGVPELA